MVLCRLDSWMKISIRFVLVLRKNKVKNFFSYYVCVWTSKFCLCGIDEIKADGWAKG